MAFGKDWQKTWWGSSRFFKTLNTNHFFNTLMEKTLWSEFSYELQ